LPGLPLKTPLEGWVRLNTDEASKEARRADVGVLFVIAMVYSKHLYFELEDVCHLNTDAN
jgi:hypothetical protein